MSTHSYSRPYTTKYGLSANDFIGYSSLETMRKSRSSRMDNGRTSSNFGYGLYSSSPISNGLNNRLYRSSSCERALNLRSNTSSIHGYSSNCYPLTKVSSLTDRTNRPSINKSYETSISKSSSRTDVVDYKHLYEMEKRKQEELLETVAKLKKLAAEIKNNENHDSCLQQPYSNGHSGSLSGKFSELQEKNKELEEAQQEHKKLKQENLALIRVMAKLSKSG